MNQIGKVFFLRNKLMKTMKMGPKFFWMIKKGNFQLTTGFLKSLKMLILLVSSLMLNPVFGDICPQPKPNVCDAYGNNSASANQLIIFKESTKGPVGYLTTTTGVLLDEKSANEVINDNLIFSDRFMEGLTSLVREVTIPRVVHAKGGGAFGYFIVTDDVTDVTNIDMFSKKGKKTPLLARFSPTFPDFGGPDTVRDNKGFAIKFYTTEGIFDFLGLSFPVFPIKDPIKFPAFIHSVKRNPQTFLEDPNTAWDFVTQNPESAFFVLNLFSDIGIPCLYQRMPGYTIHTFQTQNDKGEVSFIRFRLEPDIKEKGLSSAEATLLAGENPDYLNQALYDAIANGAFPSWTLNIQVVREGEVNKASLDIFDVTLDLPEDQYIPRPVGKVFLNKNPENYFRDIEQAAFNPRHVIPGLQGLDKLFEARSFVYLDAHNYRLGSNHNRIPVNSPHPYAKALTYLRDGAQPLGDNGGSTPNYFPNSFYGPVPIVKSKAKPRHQVHTNPNPTNFGQAKDFFNNLPKDEQDRVVENIVGSLSLTTADFLPERAVALFTQIDKGLGFRLEVGLAEKSRACSQPPKVPQHQQPEKQPKPSKPLPGHPTSLTNTLTSE